jgi:hypothetical protein
MAKLLRQDATRERLGGIGPTKFHEDYIATGRLQPVPLGKRAFGFLEADVDRLIDELVAEAKANPNWRASGPNDWRDKWKSDPLETRKKNKNRARRAVT